MRRKVLHVIYEVHDDFTIPFDVDLEHDKSITYIVKWNVLTIFKDGKEIYKIKSRYREQGSPYNTNAFKRPDSEQVIDDDDVSYSDSE